MSDNELKPKIICFCGSLKRAKEAFKEWEYLTIMRGDIALMPACMFIVGRQYMENNKPYLEAVHKVHRAKIDMCDEVFILNVGGYIGKSTHDEIAYAFDAGKPVKYLEPNGTTPSLSHDRIPQTTE